MIMSMEPSHITSSVDQILNHPTMEALLSTLYTTAVKLRIDGAAPPGFVTPGTFFPPLQSVPQTQDYRLGVLNAEVGNLRKLQNIPIAAFLTVLVDLFLVTPGMEVFKEEIDENGEQVTRESAIAGTARVAVLAFVAGLTLAFSG